MMRSLSEKITELSSNVGKIITFKDKKQEDASFTEVTDSLGVIGNGLAELETPIDIMIESKIKLEGNPPHDPLDIQSIPEIIVMTNNFKERFDEDKNVISEPFPKKEFGPEKNYKYFEKKCKKIKEDLDSTLNESWAKSVKAKIPEGLNVALITLLKRVASKELSKILSGIEEELSKIYEIANKLPTEINVIDDLDNSIKSLKEKWEQVDIQFEIIKFLREAHTPKGASFESFTNTVKNWLEKNGELKNAKIIFNQRNLFH